MKKIAMTIALVLAVLAGASCDKLNEVQNLINKANTSIDDAQAKLDAARKDIAELQSKISGGCVIVKVEETEDGIVISLSDGSKYVVTNGKDGKDGKDGDSFFQSVTIDDENGLIIIVLADGTTLSFPIISPARAVSSFSFMPRYSDGKATFSYFDGTEYDPIELDFAISPASALDAIMGLEIGEGKDIEFLAAAVSQDTRAFETVQLSCTAAFNADGILTVTVDPAALFDAANEAVLKGDFALQVLLSDGGDAVASGLIPVYKFCSKLDYAGESYHTVMLKDGKVWMAENLRYVPAGITPSKSLTDVAAGVYYPAVVSGSAAAFSDAEEDIKARGYLYQSEVALGLKVNDIVTEVQAQALEGAQGICPNGWHIPTIGDFVGLVGKAVSPIETNPDAPYYDGKNGSLKMLNEAGFNMLPYGAVTVQDNTKTSATLMGYLKTYPDNLTSGYYCGSSYAGITYMTSGDETSGVKNLQFYGLMPMTNKATEAEYTCNASKLSYKIGASVRCVKND